jgi:hypothetical protein
MNTFLQISFADFLKLDPAEERAGAVPAAAPVEHAAAALGQQPARIPRERLAAPRVRPIISDSDESDNERRFDDLTGKKRDCKLRKINSTLSNRKKPQNSYSDVDEMIGTSSGFKAAASPMRDHSGQEKTIAEKKRNIPWPRSSSLNKVGLQDDDEEVPNWADAAFDFSGDHGGVGFDEGKLSGIYLTENESVDSEEERDLYSHSIRRQTGTGTELPQPFNSAAYSNSQSHATDSSLQDARTGILNDTAKRMSFAPRGEDFSTTNEGSSRSTAHFPYPVKSARSSTSDEYENDLLRNLELHGRYEGRGRDPENPYRKQSRNDKGSDLKNFPSKNRYHVDKQTESDGSGGKENKFDSYIFQPKTNFNFRFDPIGGASMSGEDSVPMPMTDTSAALAEDDITFEDEGINMENIPKNILLNDNEWSSEEEVGDAAEGDLREEMVDIFEENDFMDVINARGEHLADLEIHIALDEVLGIRPNRPW